MASGSPTAAGLRVVIDPLLRAPSLELVLALVFLVGLVVVGIEIAVLTVSGRRRLPEFLPALVMGVGGVAVSSLAAPLIFLQYQAWRSVAPDQLVDWWQARSVLAAFVAFVAFDAVSYLHHLVGHHTSIGRAAHLPHHSGDWFDLSLALRQSWVPIHGIVVLPAVGLTGVGVEWFLLAAALSQLWQMLQHSCGDPPGHQWVQGWLVTPAVHELHHRAGPLRPVNLGAVLCVWDRVAGTYRAPSGERLPNRSLGNDRRSVLEVQFGGWRELFSGVSRPAVVSEHLRNSGTDARHERLMGS